MLSAPRPHLDPEPGGKEPATRAARMQLPPAALTMRAAARRTAGEAEATEKATRANADFAEAFILERALDSTSMRGADSADPAESVESVASWASEPETT